MLKCCICGGKIFDETKGSNNPWPLCHRDDHKSRCCNNCNENLVNKSGLAALRHTLNEEDKLVPYGSAIAILWSKDNDDIIDIFGKSGKLVAGYVQDISNGKMRGTWGPFPIDIKEDNWFIVDV